MILKALLEIFTASDEFKDIKQSIKKGAPVSVEGISESSFSLVAAAISGISTKQTIIITENSQKMQEFYFDLSCFTDPDLIFSIPPWETLPYEFVSPPERIEKDRIRSIYRLLSGKPGIFLTTVESLIRKMPAKEFILKKGIELKPGEDYPFDDIVRTLSDYGYSREQRVDSYGQFSVKGGIIDVFLPSHDSPLRFDFFGDTLESVREFDLLSQISYSKIDSITIYPRKELILNDSERLALASAIGELSEEIEEALLDSSSSDIKGIEDLFHLVIKPVSLASYIGDAQVIFIERQILSAKKNSIEDIFTELYSRRRSKAFCLRPEELLDFDAFATISERAVNIQVFTSTIDAIKPQLRGIPNFHGKLKSVREELSSKISEGWKVVVTTDFEGQARRLYDLLGELNPSDSFESYDEKSSLNILISPFREGIEMIQGRMFLLTDHEIFGKSYRKKKHFRKKGGTPIDSFLDLKSGDYVVHISHGIGIFRKIERMAAGGVERDFLLIEYADADKLFVSLDQITMVQKYVGMEGRVPRVDSLGRKSSWSKIRERVRESVEEIASSLIAIYSKRSVHKGYQYPPDTLWQEEFESQFEYEETPDQISAIEDVKDDMESPKPMDRLICGDVGFGKTEVAIRAAFKSVMAGRQVAILVPTTVLAMQHFSNFKRRFESYPISIEMVSRFRSKGEISAIKKRLSDGNLDIIIGTHSLLGRDVNIKNLGLLVIDEEQRFGVKHKEQIKEMRTNVDVLTLSATPIPRTLHMSLAGIRDLSIILTPPENRQAIETYVIEDNPDILRSSILAELARDGQVFYVHNRVETIDSQAAILENLVPEARCCVAHGQMGEEELEEVFIDFINKKYDILVSTTIIESGIDMPNVNTIIINRADTFGLSQLYQLKGRVGRSDKKAYAYLFHPRHIALTEDAQKRLQVISEYSELGSGFKIAMKDMEIRGAGNIVGKEQSGSIMEVGFELYCQMLDEAVKKMKGEKITAPFRTPVFIRTDFFIPDEYISDERQKIEFYKRFESCESPEEVALLAKEMEDRFGSPPPEVKILMEIESLRTIASSMKIDEIIETERNIRIRISENSEIDVTKVLKLIKTDKRLSVDTSDKNLLIFETSKLSTEKKIEELKKLLQQTAQKVISTKL